MFILHDILEKLKNEFPQSRKGQECGIWFTYTIMAIIVPFASSRTSCILRCLRSLFGFTGIRRKRFYTFMASPKIPWKRLWQTLWKMIPQPLTGGRLLLALDDYVNPKTGKKIFGCEKIFDHAAKQNQSKYPWAQNVVTVGLLKIVKGRWACLPLSYRFYHLKKSIARMHRQGGPKLAFTSKMAMAVDMITDVAGVFGRKRIIVTTDSWFGNNGLWKPLHDRLGIWIDMISRLRSNSNRTAICSICPVRMSAVGWGGPENTAGNWAMRRRWLRITDLWHRNTPSICMAATGPSWPMSVWSCSKRCAVPSKWFGFIDKPSGWLFSQPTCPCPFDRSLSIMVPAGKSNPRPVQRTETRHRQCRNANPSSAGGRQPPALLHVGDHRRLDLCKSGREDTNPSACS